MKTLKFAGKAIILGFGIKFGWALAELFMTVFAGFLLTKLL